MVTLPHGHEALVLREANRAPRAGKTTTGTESHTDELVSLARTNIVLRPAPHLRSGVPDDTVFVCN